MPVLVSMDSVHGLSYVTGATVTGHNLALAATRPECRALVPETALRQEKIHPQSLESLRMDRFIEASGDWARTQLYYFLENTTV